MAKQDQLDLNLARYALVFEKCREHAKKLAEPGQPVQEITELLFNRFWDDQTKLLDNMKSDGNDALKEAIAGRLGGNF